MEKENAVYIIHTVLYSSALQKKEILQYGTTWMNLKDIILSEIIQSQNNKYSMIPLT